MEENHEVVELKNLSNHEYLEQIKKLISDRDVLNICLFLTFKPKFEKRQEFQEKSLQEKTHEMINCIKDKKLQEKAFEKFKLDKKPINKIKTILEEAAEAYELAQYDQVISMLLPSYTQLTDQLSQMIENNKSEPQFDADEYNNVNFYLGNSFFRLKNFSKASEFYLKFQGEEPIKQRAQRMNNLGTCYAVKKSFQQALKYYNEAIKSYNECPSEDSSNLLNNIALIYLKCEMYKNAEDFFTRSIEERKVKSPNHKTMLFNSYFNLGICRRFLGKYDECLNSLYIAVNYTDECTTNGIDALSEICQTYEMQSKWSEALTYYERLSKNYDLMQKPQGPIYERVSKIHLKMGNVILASKFAKNAYKEYRAAGDERKMSEISNSVVVKMSVSD